MQINKKWRLGAIASVAAVATILGGSSAAMADPTLPTFRALSGAGSDTTQDLNNGLSAVLGSVGSYNATNPTTGAIHDLIRTRTGGALFERPNGSSEGVNALKAAKAGTAWRGVTLSDADLQFARSSSPASGGWVANGAYSYIPLALDAVSFAVHESNSTIPRDLSKAELTAVYTAANGSTVNLDGTSYTVGLPGTGAQITPFAPQAGSGTRSFWQAQVAPTGFGSAVAFEYSGAGVQEHDGSVLEALPATAVVPFSVAQHIAQENSDDLAAEYGITVNDRLHGAELGAIDGVDAVTTGTLNTAFPIARPVFTVVKHSELATNAALAATFLTEDGSAYTALNPETESSLVITDFGFGDISGGVTINGAPYTSGDATSYRAN